MTIKDKTWRHAGRGERVRRVNYGKLKITENKEIFRERVTQEIHTKKDGKKENVTNWVEEERIMVRNEEMQTSRHSSVTYVERSARSGEAWASTETQKEDALRVALVPRFQMPPMQ